MNLRQPLIWNGLFLCLVLNYYHRSSVTFLLNHLKDERTGYRKLTKCPSTRWKFLFIFFLILSYFFFVIHDCNVYIRITEMCITGLLFQMSTQICIYAPSPFLYLPRKTMLTDSVILSYSEH